MSKPVIYGKEKNRIILGFKLLAAKGRKWSESHAPKIKEHQL